MQNRFKYFVLFVVATFGVLFPWAAFAQELVATPAAVLAPPVGLDWVEPVLQLLSNIPYLGAAVLFLMKWVGAVAAFFTLISVFVQGVLAIPEVAARFSGATKLADKIKSIADFVLPFLKKLSIFNVQKKV